MTTKQKGHRFQAASLHPDGTVCTHRLTSRGRPTEEGCAGRARFNATCSCGRWDSTGSVRAELKYQHDVHRSHPAKPTGPRL